MTEIETKRDGVGNTETTPSKQTYQYQHYGFTWNNYKERDIETLIKVLNQLCYMYVFQEEIGKDKGTPHLQGTFSLVKRARYTEFGLSRKIHFEAPVKDLAASYEYCSRLSKRAPGGRVWSLNYEVQETMDLIQEDQFYDYQRHILNIIMQEPDKRKIYWINGEQGIGKSALQKYLVSKTKAIILSGKPSDMKNGIVNYYNKFKKCPRLIVSNIGYDKCLNMIHYSGYEDIKDMCFYSGKYEGGMICGPNPHLFIFANGKPETDNNKFVEIKASKFYTREDYFKHIVLPQAIYQANCMKLDKAMERQVVI